ncbi:hypothetical protein SAY86_020739 [Trapa natans]|uniref:Late embryogenesis abundant protein LEA-2 subgroup domain-containing protein n=1 Tax=Trapa natans TaxID=22666 RepID=A0AAN7RE90_TRANT|nr:hypothetical protein SAY86_020739 [Trapa natans]
MASSPDPDQPKRHGEQEGSSPSISNSSPPPSDDASRSLESHPQQPPPLATGGQPDHQTPQPQPYQQQSQAVGYPPVIGYPPGHQPPPYPHGYGPYTNYGGAPPPPQGGYYSNPTYLPPQGPPARPAGAMVSGLARGILTAIIILVVLSAIFSVFSYTIVRPKQPIFRLASFSVTNFNISNAVLTASWDAKMFVENPNHKLTAHFDRIQNYVYYKDPGNYLAFNSDSPVSVGTDANTTMTLRASMINNEQPNKSLLEEMENDRKSRGSVRFGMAIRLIGTFRSSSWNVVERIQVSCQDITVTFNPPATTTGNFTRTAGDTHKECSIYVA